MDATALAALWASVEGAVADHASWSPGALPASTWTEIATGKVVRARSPVGATGVGVLRCSLAEAWLAVTDDHPVQAVEGLQQVALSGRWASEKWLYQLIDLPWPVVDRHWVLHSRNNPRLAGFGVWERAWTLAEDWLPRARAEVGAERFDAAQTVVVNDGSWMLVAIDAANTFGVYQARVDLGGALPSGATDAYTNATLGELFRSTEANAHSMRTRYRAPCDAQPGPDGRAIPCF